MTDILFIKRQAVYKRYGSLIFLFKLKRKSDSIGAFGVCGVENYNKRLIYLFKLGGNARLRSFVICAAYLTERAVAGDKHCDGSVLSDDFFSSDLCRAVKRHTFVGPRCHNHSNLTVFVISKRFGNDVTYAVYHLAGKFFSAVESDGHGFVRNKFRLCCHNGLACRRLRHFVLCALFIVLVCDIGNDDRFHKFFYKCRFARSDGADNAYVDVARRTRGYVAVNIAHFVSSDIFFFIAKYIYENLKI